MNDDFHVILLDDFANVCEMIFPSSILKNTVECRKMMSLVKRLGHPSINLINTLIIAIFNLKGYPGNEMAVKIAIEGRPILRAMGPTFVLYGLLIFFFDSSKKLCSSLPLSSSGGESTTKRIVQSCY